METKTLSKKQKKRIEFWLDRLNEMAIGAYGLLTGEKWLLLFDEKLTVDGGALLVFWSLVLITAWIIIGEMQSSLEDNGDEPC